MRLRRLSPLPTCSSKICMVLEPLLHRAARTIAMPTRSKRWARNDHWLARISFGLVVAGIAAWLVTLYWTGPFDF
jgi:hypothetical protein